MTIQMKPGAVLFAKDIARVAKFYSELAGLQATLEQSDLIVLESDHFQLVVHPIPKPVAKAITIGNPPKRRVDLPVKLIFPVASIAAVRAAAPALGGELNPPGKELVARGFRACDGHDAEGNVVQFRQPAAP